CDYDAICVGEAMGEGLQQIAHARITVGLDDGNDSALGSGTRSLQNCGDFYRMVGVVVIDCNAVPGTGALESAFNTRKACHAFANLSAGNADLARDSNGGQSVKGVMATGYWHTPIFEPARPALYPGAKLGIEVGHGACNARIFKNDICSRADPIRQ